MCIHTINVGSWRFSSRIGELFSLCVVQTCRLPKMLQEKAARLCNNCRGRYCIVDVNGNKCIMMLVTYDLIVIIIMLNFYCVCMLFGKLAICHLASYKLTRVSDRKICTEKSYRIIWLSLTQLWIPPPRCYFR